MSISGPQAYFARSCEISNPGVLKAPNFYLVCLLMATLTIPSFPPRSLPSPQARASTSTAMNKPPLDLDPVRRRRSTNSKPYKARTHPYSTNESHQKDASSIKSFKAVTSPSSHAMPLPKTQATVPQMPSKSSSAEGKNSERAVHFVVKGARHTLSDGGISPGQKHHVYPREVVPYPRSYEQEVIDL